MRTEKVLKQSRADDEQLHKKLQQLLDFREEKRTRLTSDFLDVMIDTAKKRKGVRHEQTTGVGINTSPQETG